MYLLIIFFAPLGSIISGFLGNKIGSIGAMLLSSGSLFFSCIFSTKLRSMLFKLRNLLFKFKFMEKKKFNRYYFSNNVLEILENFYNQDQKIFVTSAVAITLSILLASSIWWINRPGGGDRRGGGRPNEDNKPSEGGDYIGPIIPIRELVTPEEQLVGYHSDSWSFSFREIESLLYGTGDEDNYRYMGSRMGPYTSWDFFGIADRKAQIILYGYETQLERDQRRLFQNSHPDSRDLYSLEREYLKELFVKKKTAELEPRETARFYAELEWKAQRRAQDEALELSAQAADKAAKEVTRLRSIASLEEKAADEAAEIALEEAALRQAVIAAQPAVGDPVEVAVQPVALPSGSDGGGDPASKPNFILRLIYFIMELLF
jgi:hypothetical protein